MARKGEKPEMRVNNVHVEAFDILDLEDSNAYFRVVCSKGTYIRSLANDLGELLSVGAYLKELRRTKIGDFDVINAFSMEEIAEQLEKIES